MDGRRQLGPIEVEFEVLRGSGVDLDAFAASVGADAIDVLPAGTPRAGWRLLSGTGDRFTIGGAPVDDSRQQWRLAQLRLVDGSVRSLSVQPTTFPLRSSRKARAGGLELRWPAVTRSAPELDLLAIDVVNAGADRWHPQGDAFVVTAALVPHGQPYVGVWFGWIGGTSPALPLDPGEYARVRVIIDSGSWTGAARGPYEVHPRLTDLGLVGPPLAVELTEEDIRLHSAVARRTPPRP